MTRFALFRSLLPAAFLALAPGLGAQAGTGPAPQTIGGARVVEIAAGAQHSCARVETGRVHCWGRNNYGQLGDGTTTNRLTPVQLQGLTAVTQIAAGSRHSCVLRGTGRVFCWGSNGQGQLGSGTTVDEWTPIRVHD